MTIMNFFQFISTCSTVTDHLVNFLSLPVNRRIVNSQLAALLDFGLIRLSLRHLPAKRIGVETFGGLGGCRTGRKIVATRNGWKTVAAHAESRGETVSPYLPTFETIEGPIRGGPARHINHFCLEQVNVEVSDAALDHVGAWAPKKRPARTERSLHRTRKCSPKASTSSEACPMNDGGEGTMTSLFSDMHLVPRGSFGYGHHLGKRQETKSPSTLQFLPRPLALKRLSISSESCPSTPRHPSLTTPTGTDIDMDCPWTP